MWYTGSIVLFVSFLVNKIQFSYVCIFLRLETLNRYTGSIDLFISFVRIRLRLHMQYSTVWFRRYCTADNKLLDGGSTRS
jgi:hypothetical protein